MQITKKITKRILNISSCKLPKKIVHAKLRLENTKLPISLSFPNSITLYLNSGYIIIMTFFCFFLFWKHNNHDLSPYSRF